MGKFLDPLRLEFLDGRRWELTAAFDYRLGSPDGDEAVRVPRGFVTDFASIPRVLWNVLPPAGPYGKAAVLHDWLYQQRAVHKLGLTSYVGRAEADAILLEAMTVLNVGRVTRQLIYRGVRVGGWLTWNRYRREENA